MNPDNIEEGRKVKNALDDARRYREVLDSGEYDTVKEVQYGYCKNRNSTRSVPAHFVLPGVVVEAINVLNRHALDNYIIDLEQHLEAL